MFMDKMTFQKPLLKNVNPIVYHLTSNDPWRASIVISDATNLKNLGYNVTILLSIEGVQVGVKNPHHHLNLDNVVANVTNFIKDGGKVVVCGVCLEVAGFEPNDIIDGAIIGTAEITPKLFTNATVVTYWQVIPIYEIKYVFLYSIHFDINNI